jgi:NAD(P)-dependent dehydrogenase (short-subunit alcohol dehydrogenase family)
MFSLKNKVAVITGGASGIGKATGLRFSEAGAKVVLADIQDGSEAAKQAGGLFVKTDVSKEDEVKALMEAAVSKYGKLDIVVNNAGIGEGNEIKDISEAEIDRILNVNTKGVLWGMKHAVPHISDGGSIINTSSYAGLTAFPSYGSYTASKCAVIGFTKTAALELAPRGIRVNAVCPGTIDTPINEGPMAEVELALATHIHPLRRVGQPEEVAALFHFLASDESSFITGVAIPIDGGLSAGIGMGIIEPLLGVIMGGDSG